MSNTTKDRVTRKNTFGDFYILGKELGRGASAGVYKCEQKGTGKHWAVKIIKDKKYKRLAASEVGILLKLKHPNIVRLKETFQSPECIHLVLELVTGGELFERIASRGHYSEKEAAKAVKDICSAVSYLHKYGVVHRDLKPENILYENSTECANLKIADFGLSKIMDKELTMTTVCGTPAYCAPEVLEGKTYTQSVDMWSVGVIMYILLAGYEPFIAERDSEMYRKIIKCDYEFDSPYWDNISENGKYLVRKMLSLDAKKRLTANEALQHPWVNGMATKSNHMEACVEHIKTFNAKRKLKYATEAVLAIAKATRHLPLDMMNMVNLDAADDDKDRKEVTNKQVQKVK